MILGINVGRVLINATDDKAPDTSFIGGSLEDALRTLPYEGMFAVVPRLARKFEGRVWIVSKCGPRVQDKTRAYGSAAVRAPASTFDTGAHLGRNRSNAAMTRAAPLLLHQYSDPTSGHLKQ